MKNIKLVHEFYSSFLSMLHLVDVGFSKGKCLGSHIKKANDTDSDREWIHIKLQDTRNGCRITIECSK